MIPQLKLNDIPDLFLDKGRGHTKQKYWVRLDFVNNYIKHWNDMDLDARLQVFVSKHKG